MYINIILQIGDFNNQPFNRSSLFTPHPPPQRREGTLDDLPAVVRPLSSDYCLLTSSFNTPHPSPAKEGRDSLGRPELIRHWTFPATAGLDVGCSYFIISRFLIFSTSALLYFRNRQHNHAPCPFIGNRLKKKVSKIFLCHQQGYRQSETCPIRF
jgi:hypothetical protein